MRDFAEINADWGEELHTTGIPTRDGVVSRARDSRRIRTVKAATDDLSQQRAIGSDDQHIVLIELRHDKVAFTINRGISRTSVYDGRHDGTDAGSKPVNDSNRVG